MSARTCCLVVIEQYESIDRAFAEIAKARGGVALFCETCKGRVVFADGSWSTSGGVTP